MKRLRPIKQFSHPRTQKDLQAHSHCVSHWQFSPPVSDFQQPQPPRHHFSPPKRSKRSQGAVAGGFSPQQLALLGWSLARMGGKDELTPLVEAHGV